MTERVLSIDPGTTHLAACIFEIDRAKGTITLLWSELFNVGHQHRVLAEVCKVMHGVSQKLHTNTALVEYQAPMGAAHTCRWNAFIEGGLTCCLSALGMHVEVLHPSAVKRKLGLATGNYRNNKLLAFQHAKEKGQNINSHHEADCFILAEWWSLN